MDNTRLKSMTAIGSAIFLLLLIANTPSALAAADAVAALALRAAHSLQDQGPSIHRSPLLVGLASLGLILAIVGKGMGRH
ncbi:MAG: hypothetical protein EKK46_10155 [Rhodocyclaceae bacterium]|nr:MAG: hypothetical protein EKK46_10155 [Rhodocyclaceae bacterium]